MSYTEYLRRKLAGEPVVVNNQKLRSASEITRQRRLLAASYFPVNGQGVGTMRGDLLLAETSVNPKQPTSFQKNTGRPKDASDFTAYLGAHALQNGNTFVSGTTQNAGKNVQPAACTVNSAAQITEPSPYITGTTGQVKATTVPRSASDYIRERIACQKAQGEQHIQNELGPSIFVDDTIRKPEYNKQYLSGATSCVPNVKFPAVDHVHPVTVPRVQTGVLARPAKAKIPNYDQQFVSQDHTPPVMGTNTIPNCFTGKNVVGKYNTGAVIPSKHPRYVERHHGNDLATMVNGRKPVPGEYQIPAGTPAHLKINDPIGPRVPGM